MPHELNSPKNTFSGRSAIWIFLVFSVFYIGITRGHFISTDEISVYQTTRSLWEEGNLSIVSVKNAIRGKDGRYYSGVNAGQSVAALPLYGIGKALRHVYTQTGREDCIRTFAGSVIERKGGVRWGGDIEIFFVNLFNSFVTALTCAVFYLFSLKLGSLPKYALLSTVLLGITSYIAPYSTYFYQHASETLFLLCAFYFLFSDSQNPDWKFRMGAGAMVALMLQFRFPSIISLPGLLFYMIWSIWQRKPSEVKIKTYFSSAIIQILPFVAMIVFSFIVHLAVNYSKFGNISVSGGYGMARFNNPLITGLYGFLLSPGESIFLYTPLLLLCPFTFRVFYRKHRQETVFIFILLISYLLFYGSFEYWHGMYCFGPRYLVPLIPLLLLPLGNWLQNMKGKAWFAVIILSIIGFWVQLVHVTVNFWKVIICENYINYKPLYSFLFSWKAMPIIAHSKAFFAADQRMDMWLINVYRTFGLGRTLTVALPLFIVFAAFLWKLSQSIQKEVTETAPGYRPHSMRYVIISLSIFFIITGSTMVIDHYYRIAQEEKAKEDIDKAKIDAMEALYREQDYERAASLFQKVLKNDPFNYEVTFYLAVTLDRLGRTDEAYPLWERILRMAEIYQDKSKADMARNRIKKKP